MYNNVIEGYCVVTVMNVVSNTIMQHHSCHGAGGE